MQKSATATFQEPAQEPWQSASRSVVDYPTEYPTGHNSNLDEEAPRSAFSIIEPPAELSTLTTHLTGHSTDNTFPDGGLQAWCVVAGSFCLLMATFGVMNTTGILQNYFATHQLASYSPSAIGWIPGLFTFFGLSISVQVGPMFDRYGPKAILVTGTVCYVTGLILLAESRLYWHFVLSLGVLSGTGAALLSTVALASVPQWFDRKAALAIGISMAGAGLGGVVFPFVLRAGFTSLGYKWTIRLLASVVLVLCVAGTVLVKARLPKGRSKSTVNLRSLQDARFTWLTLGIFGLELEVFAGLGLYPTYVIMQGFSTNTSVILLAVLNIASTVGRLVAGGVADRFGRINTQTALIAVGAFAVFVIWLPFGNSLVGLYMFSVIFGLSSGSFLSLAPACIGQISKASEVGGRFGLTYSIVSFATLICIPIGGEMLDKVGKRAMVAYLGSVLIVSLGLFVMARWACLSYRWRWQAKI
ncbi:Major facilitator superfamily domain general substrate transporter [Penicillium robsamsonii]|uniref:Major facilitator superfamily domain general substrate transporter n=1 Tax=Penicillium robsamsonii TaxID=1792511 RepID=UPI0025491C66|nr:Major facilitator superfamily domain general substrate transporter [Penicillium robsamsonii]KAJ5823832.1 Major facilitator superfamily domain general substrate transporter [Penicillium robsamsonii]